MAVEVTTRQKSRKMIDDLQGIDSEIERVIVMAKKVIVFFKDDVTGEWREPGIEGPMYLVGRYTAPFYQLLIHNELGMPPGEYKEGLVDSMDSEWEFDSKERHIMYKTSDPSKNVRMMWFPEDAVRMKCQASFEIMLDKEKRGVAGPMFTAKIEKKSKEEMEAMTSDSLFKQFGVVAQADIDPNKQVKMDITKKDLSEAFIMLADDDAFIDLLMQKFYETKSDLATSGKEIGYTAGGVS